MREESRCIYRQNLCMCVEVFSLSKVSRYWQLFKKSNYTSSDVQAEIPAEGRVCAGKGAQRPDEKL